MNEIKIFNFDTKRIRIVDKNNNPYFVLSDACSILDIQNVGNVVSRLNKDDIHTMDVTDSIGRSRSTIMINEIGLYDIILQSRKPKRNKSVLSI